MENLIFENNGRWYKLTELGNRLKEARIAKGLSLDDLQSITKIQKRYLIGIEEGDYSVMPGNFYVRAFIKQYTEAVHLNPDDIFQTYKNEIPASYNDDLPDQLSRVKTRKTLSDRGSKFMDILPKVLIAIFIIGAAVLLYYLLQHNAGSDSKEANNKQNEPVNFEKSNNLEKAEAQKQDKKKESTKKEDSKDDSGSSAQVEAPKQEITVVQNNGSSTIYEVKNADKFVVKVVSKGQTWVNIKNSKGVSLFQGMLKTGGTDNQTVDLSSESEAMIVVGRTIDTEIYVNDQKIEYAVPPTQVVRQDITIRYVPKNK